ncbi:cytosolic arginine sensor for mTORC1 subunit 2 isoform 3-T3 [Spinachia spinachia]
MELHILEHSLKVASIAKEGIQICTHGLVKLAFLASRTSCKFFSLTETPEDYTLIVDEEGFKELPQSEHISVADATWVALNVVSGGGNASNSQPIGVTKIAKSVIAPLADHNISVFMLSTYQTDFILVSQQRALHQRFRGALENGSDRRTTFRVRRVRHRGSDIGAAGHGRHPGVLHQHLQVRPRSGSRGEHPERDRGAAHQEHGRVTGAAGRRRLIAAETCPAVSEGSGGGPARKRWRRLWDGDGVMQPFSPPPSLPVSALVHRLNIRIFSSLKLLVPPREHHNYRVSYVMNVLSKTKDTYPPYIYI